MKKLRLRPFIIFLVIVGAFVLMILDSAQFLKPVQNVIHSLFRPITIALDDSWRTASDMVATVQDLRTLRERNNELEARVDRLTVENLQLAEAVIENQQLRDLLNFATTNPRYDYRGGQIIARPLTSGVSPFLDTIEIDLGAVHGLETGMPVVTDRGLVGRIRNVYPHSSEVLLLTDASSSVNVITQASRAFGVLHGRNQQLPLMDFIPNDIEIAPGEIVMTSGLGGNFPKGLVVGQITEVIHNDNKMFQQAIVKPTVSFNRLELVLVITRFTPSEESEIPLPESPTPTPAP